jgi:hypothetical protein
MDIWDGYLEIYFWRLIELTKVKVSDEKIKT